MSWVGDRPWDSPRALNQGWQCPVCGTVYAPTIPSCMKNHIVTQTTITAQPLPVAHYQGPDPDYCVCGRKWPCFGAMASSITLNDVRDTEAGN